MGRQLRQVIVFISELRSFYQSIACPRVVCGLWWCCDLLSSVHQRSLCLCQTCHQELPSLLRLECYFVISRTPGAAPQQRLRIFPHLFRVLGYQLLVHSTTHACYRRPPRSASPTTTTGHFEVVCCRCKQEVVFRTMTPREESDPKQG